MDKPWYASRTLWLNVLSLVIVVITAAVDTDLVKQNPELVLTFMAIVNILNAILRFLTKTGVTLMLLLLACGLSHAAEVAVVLDDSKPGTFLVTVGADGSIAVNPIRVVRPGSNPSPPTDPPTTGTPFEAEVEKQTKAVLTAGGTATTGAALSSVYSLVADEVAAGRIAPASALPAVKSATDLVMTKQADAAAWTPWRAAVGDALTILQGQGSLGTKEQFAAALRQVSNGLNKATGFKGNPQGLLALKPAQLGILDNIDLAKIVELIKLVMELLKLFGGFAK